MGVLPDDINLTYIVLIPKKSNPKLISHMRPISLCNVLYKVIAKTLANRVKLVLPDIIVETPSAFVPGCLISDNILVAFEVVHYLKNKRKGKHGLTALKVDISKVYDMIEWGFLEAMMVKLNFDS